MARTRGMKTKANKVRRFFFMDDAVRVALSPRVTFSTQRSVTAAVPNHYRLTRRVKANHNKQLAVVKRRQSHKQPSRPEGLAPSSTWDPLSMRWSRPRGRSPKGAVDFDGKKGTWVFSPPTVSHKSSLTAIN